MPVVQQDVSMVEVLNVVASLLSRRTKSRGGQHRVEQMAASNHARHAERAGRADDGGP